MTITKSDIDKWIEAEAEQWVFEINGHRWSNNNNECGDNFGSFRQGAQLTADLLLKACEALKKCRDESGQAWIQHISDKTLTQIEHIIAGVK